MTTTARHQGGPGTAETAAPTIAEGVTLHAVGASESAALASVADLAGAMDAFVRSKGWYGPDSKRPQTPRNLASSLVIEAGELLECFQWGDEPDRGDLEDELADVVLYALQLANVIDADLAAVVAKKLERNKIRAWDGA